MFSIPISNWNDSLDDIRNSWDRAVRKPSEISYALDTYGDLPVSIDEQDERFVIEMEMPKYTMEDVKITTREHYLRVQASRSRTEDSGKTVERVARVFRLPDSVDTSKLQGTFEGGVLKLEIPKR